MRLCRFGFFCLLLALLAGAFASESRAARDASFLAPSASSTRTGNQGEGAVGVEPKNEIDLGETGVNVAKRTTLFFVNQTNLPVGILSITANGDSTVDAEIVADDCSKEKQIAPASRCSVSVEVTPKGSGLWTAEVLMTHDGAGRLARAKLSGKTKASSGNKEMEGLALSTKNIKPVDFEEVEIGSGKAVRSALMVNDSDETITILSIEVIAPENGLERLDQGCMEDMDLKPGESCPVTLLWDPKSAGAISTDLIIRHSGRLGFAVIPIRGIAKAPKEANGAASLGVKASGSVVSMSPSADDVERMIETKAQALSMEPVSSSDLVVPAVQAEPKAGLDGVHLIGTVGNRGLFYMPDGTTAIVAVGETLPISGDGVKLLEVTPKQAALLVNGEAKTLLLEQASALTKKAAQARKSKGLGNKKEPMAKKAKTSKSSPSISEE